MAMDFLTVATTNYMPQAIATLASARRAGRYASYNCFVLDAPSETIVRLHELLQADVPWVRLFGPHDLTYERDRYFSTFAYYDAFELSCFAKYLGAAHLLRAPTAADICVYADADFLFVGDLSVANVEIGNFAGLLTPHHLRPASINDEMEHMRTGWLNAGFFCLRRDHQQTANMLAWLIERISRFGFSAPQHGMFVDQTWLSAALFAFPNHMRLSEHPGLNIAYWNLKERALEETERCLVVDRVPIQNFHFSGFDPANPGRLSKHSDIPIADASPLAHLRDTYIADLAYGRKVAATASRLPRLPCSEADLAARMRTAEKKSGTAYKSPFGDNDLPAVVRHALKTVLYRLSRCPVRRRPRRERFDPG